MMVYLVLKEELEKVFSALGSDLFPAGKLGPGLPVHTKHLKELGISQELLPFPRVNILRQLLDACGEDGIGVEGTAATNGPLPIVPVTHHLLQGLLLLVGIQHLR